MTMPKWHEIMRPVLEELNKADILTSAELMKVVIATFNLSDDEQAERLKTGKLRINNRVYWGITYLHKAGYVEYGDKKGTYRITPEGRKLLSSHVGPITSKVLFKESEQFRQWRQSYEKTDHGHKKDGANENNEDDLTEQSSPQEIMQDAYSQVREALADDLLSAIMQHDPYFFEYLVGKLLSAMGYGETYGDIKITQKSGDEGIDGIVKEDRLGFDSVYYQAKRWSLDSTVGRPDIQSFVGALSVKGASKGLFITTAKFSTAAREYAEALNSQKIVLIDGRALAELMIDYNVGVSTVETFEIKTIDSDFFADE